MIRMAVIAAALMAVGFARAYDAKQVRRAETDADECRKSDAHYRTKHADDPRLMDSTGALELEDIPKRLLVIGGGIIGLEMATVYDALGSKVSIVELSPGLIPGCDRDLVRPLEKRVKKRYENIWLNAKVTNIKAQKSGLKVSFEGNKAPDSDTFDRVLLAVVGLQFF